MPIHPKWKYVYWFAAFGFFGIVIESFYIFSWRPALMVLAVLCFSAVSTYIYKKMSWMRHNIIRVDLDNTD